MDAFARTKENINYALALNYYGRVLFIEELLPLLRVSPLGGKVVSVLNSKKGDPSKISWNNMGLETKCSFLVAINHAFAFNDLIIQYLASQPENSNVSFIHSFPGHVKTPIIDNLPFYIRLPIKAVGAIRRLAVSPDECAEFMIHANAARRLNTIVFCYACLKRFMGKISGPTVCVLPRQQEINLLNPNFLFGNDMALKKGNKHMT
ncbi:unnamed protein product [Adineta steineri]|uniref:Uncharacterized protein n=1 Tax=Adineta steineri TaxID=433720 RepID=A0A820CU80_9BILA|nr:unnamed protein product [Adineta steineri]